MLFAVALVHRYYALGGPYFTFPKTVQDHVSLFLFPSRDVILLAGRAAEIIPRGATVTALNPPEAPNYDVTLWMTAFGTMPRHRVVPPKFDQSPPQYVLVVREPWADEKYRLMTELPEGRIYELKR